MCLTSVNGVSACRMRDLLMLVRGPALQLELKQRKLLLVTNRPLSECTNSVDRCETHICPSVFTIPLPLECKAQDA